MKKQLTTLAGSSLVIASAFALSATHASAANLTSTVLDDFSNWKTGGQACDAVGTSMTYNDCIGSFSTRSTKNDVLGDGRGSLLDALGTGVFGGITDWSFGGKQDAGAQTQGAAVDYGFQWSENGNGAGTWSLTGAVENLYADVVLSLKTATSWSAYYIEKGTALSDFQDLLWNTSGVDLAGNGRNGNGKALSHASVFFANIEQQTPVVSSEPVDNEPAVSEPVTVEPTDNDLITPLYPAPMEGVEIPSNPQQAEAVDIPEPGMMLGLGLVGTLVGFRRRKSAKR